MEQTRIRPQALVVGQGYVGKAMVSRLSQGLFEVHTYDIKDGDLDTRGLEDIDIVFLCTYLDINQVGKGTEALQGLIDQYTQYCPHALIVICSTVHPEQFDELTLPRHVVYMPEFFTAKQLDSNEDYTRCIVGVENDEVRDRFNTLMRVYLGNVSSVLYLTLKEAALVKLATNAYLAMRVTFMNTIADLASEYDGDPHQVLYALGSDPRIGRHYNRPSFAYSGPCIPKDIKALGKSIKQRVAGDILNTTYYQNSERESDLLFVMQLLETGGKRIGINRLGFAPGATSTKDSHLVKAARIIHARSPDTPIYFYDQDVVDTPQGFVRCEGLVYLFANVDVVFSESIIDDMILRTYPQVEVVYPWTLRRYLNEQ